MKEIYEINLEDGMPPANKAIKVLRKEIEFCKRYKYKCAIIIHGYGSTGKGGAIGQKARKWLLSKKETKEIKNVIKGGEFDKFNPIALKLKNIYPQLGKHFGKCNPGITIIEL